MVRLYHMIRESLFPYFPRVEGHANGYMEGRCIYGFANCGARAQPGSRTGCKDKLPSQPSCPTLRSLLGEVRLRSENSVRVVLSFTRAFRHHIFRDVAGAARVRSAATANGPLVVVVVRQKGTKNGDKRCLSYRRSVRKKTPTAGLGA